MDVTAESLGHEVLRRTTLVSIPIGAIVAVYFGLWGPLAPGESRVLAVVSNLVLTAVFIAVFALAHRARIVRLLRGELGWMAAGAPPTAEVAERLTRLPQRVGTSVLQVTTLVAGITAALNLTFERTPAESVRILVGLVLIGVVVSALAYLTAERVLRPVFVTGLAELRGGRARRGAIGVRHRLVLAWAIGSGVPLLFVMTIPLGHGNGVELSPEVPAAFMAAAGLFIGAVTTITVARSVADPLDALRSAFDMIEAGDLDVHVPIDDPGEIGRLEAGFDRMVAGLRERRQLEDLFGRHVGVDVARHALDAGVRLGGERREVSVLFVDVIGSTALSDTVEPEVVLDALNRVFDAVVRIAGDDGGWIDKFAGDAALVVFGAPLPTDDHAARCLRVARRLRDALVASEAAGGLGIGIGASTGIAVAGNVGSEERYDYTVIGRPVNESARLTELAKDRPARLLASAEAIARSGAEAANWRAAGSVVLRGFAAAVDVYEPT
jgi:adenylate cyclase